MKKIIHWCLGSAAFVLGCVLFMGAFSLALGCSADDDPELISLRPCDPTGSTSSGGSTSGVESGSSTTEGPDVCPDLRGGVAHAVGNAVTFCPSMLGGVCRDVLVVNAANANNTGPLEMQWHGTYENPDGYMSWDFATGSLEDMVVAEHGLLVLPYADAQATGRVGPFPWWIVGDPSVPANQTDRLDDFILFDEVVRCAIEQDLASPDRIVTSGMSAGAIMVSHIVNRHNPMLDGYQIAAAVSWSGGLPPQYQPATPSGNVPMMLTQGGDTDVYCGPGNAPGSCGGYEPYSFMQPTEHLATAVDADAYAFVCRHPWGHGSTFGPTAADFLRYARANMMHPWQPYTATHFGDWSLAYCGEALP